MTGKSHIRAEASLAMKAARLGADCIYIMGAHPSLCSHHIKDELILIKVGLFLYAADDAALDHHPSALHLQAGRVNARQLEAFEVSNAPR